VRPLGDRRARPRFEVVGDLRGILETTEMARVVDISPAGALIVSPLGMPLGATMPVRLSLSGHDVTLDGTVRHFRLVPGTEGEPASYLIGLEFPAMPAGLGRALPPLH
jgi:hypothetical protein